MRINVLDIDTGNELFDYRTTSAPRQGETVVQNESGEELVVEQVRHRITKLGEPYVDLVCKVV